MDIVRIKDYYIGVGIIYVKDPKEFIDELRREFYEVTMQLIDINYVIDLNHVVDIMKVVIEAFERGIMVSKKLEIEILLRFAGTNQIDEALSIVGAKPDSKSLFIAMSKDKDILNNIPLTLEVLSYSNERYINMVERFKLTKNIDLRSILVERANLIY